MKRHIHAGNSGMCFCTSSFRASLGSSKELVRAAKRQLLPGAGMCPAWLPGPRLDAGLSRCPLLSTALPAETRTQGVKADNVPPQIPSKISNSASNKSICSLWDAPRFPPAKAIDANTPLQHFLLSNFPSLLRSCGANHHCVSLGHNCSSLNSNNIPEPQSGDNRQQQNTPARDHIRKAGSPYLCL